MSQADDLSQALFGAASAVFEEKQFWIGGGPPVTAIPNDQVSGDSFDPMAVAKTGSKRIVCVTKSFESAYPSDTEDYVKQTLTFDGLSWRIAAIRPDDYFTTLELIHVEQGE